MSVQPAPRLLLRAMIVIALAAGLLLLVPAQPAGAATGSYSVQVSGTGSAWHAVGGSSRLVARTNDVAARAGKISRGTWQEWRLAVPNRELAFTGGRIRVTFAIPRPELRARIRSGNAAGAVRTHVTTRSGSSVSVNLPGDATWIGFGLLAIDNLQPTSNWNNRVTLRDVNATLVDLTPPTLGLTGVGDPTAWRSGSCRTLGLTGADAGSGIVRILVRNLTTGTVIADRRTSSTRALQPGDNSVGISQCIGSSQLRHGSNELEALVVDASGRSARRTWHVQADLQAPQLDGLPADGTAFTSGTPEIEFAATDTGSGLASVTARINGAAVPVEIDGSRARLAFAGPLTVGQHQLVVTATDAVGNSTQVPRRFDVGDIRPPEITVHSPGSRGGGSISVSASATDQLSDVAPGTWSLAVDGRAIESSISGTRISASIAGLAGGRHTLRLSVADQHGNRATVTRTYEVVPPPSARLASVGTRSGIVLGSWPRQAVPFGRRVRVRVAATRAGRVLAYRAVRVRVGGTVAGYGVTNRWGVATVAVRMRRPGMAVVDLPGTGLPPARRRIAARPVATRLRGARRAAVGRTVRLRGNIRPGGQVRRIHLQVRSGRTWYAVQRNIRVSRTGSFSVRVRSSVRGRIWIRAYIPPQRGWGGAAGPGTSIRVR